MSTTTLARVEPQEIARPSLRGTFSLIKNVDDLRSYADLVARQRLFGVRDTDDALMRLSCGHDIGLTAYQALSGLYTVQGTVAMSAKCMFALCKTHHSTEYFYCVEATKERSVWVGKRKGEPEHKAEFSWDDAKAANLTSKSNWVAYREDMLRNRALSKLARRGWQDVMFGMMTVEEAHDSTDESSLGDIVNKRPEVVETVVEAVPVVADDGPLAVLVARLAGANSYEHLKQIASDRDFLEQTKALSDADRVALRKKYDEMQRALKSKPQVAA